ncbi:TfoX/Sxy family protein [Pedobacter endophyticus]|uniref:TfoX/Sxy family protein n=1 Tax=Pedobacter endophyticus TaxID=2789740 RepID=A0A7S9Q136_9SPHI|nr:TfoX/Sxy family protein [Pedobacter endophyticus]QPH41615.1 TfoX/Sxy family protein [Pedobacter endophyticus]
MRKYNEALANRIAEKLMHLPDVEEKEMFTGLIFMVDGKMCVGVSKNDLMLRLNPDDIERLNDKDGWEQMTMGGKRMSGYILVSEDVLNRNDELDFWIKLALDFNPIAKSSKKRYK